MATPLASIPIEYSRRFAPGDAAYWWKKETPFRCIPIRVSVLGATRKRITIKLAPSESSIDEVIRHVTADSLQPVDGYFAKASNQPLSILEPMSAWGSRTFYGEVGADLFLARQVHLFRNGNFLRYDRRHWVDKFGMLGEARINRNTRRTRSGRVIEIERIVFEQVWQAAGQSSLWKQQLASSLSERHGTMPWWLQTNH
jgi:hypothetical protein